jgi:RHS repeat-associated protein
MEMPVRSYNAATAANYRYGFNGKEQDPEVKGARDQYDYGMRMYDPRVGRFLSDQIAADGAAAQQALAINGKDAQLHGAALAMLSFAGMAAPGQVSVSPMIVEEQTTAPAGSRFGWENTKGIYLPSFR